VDSAIDRIRDRLQRATVPHSEVEACLGGVRRLLPGLEGNAYALRRALEVIASCGNEADRPELERHLDDLSEQDRAIVQQAWSKAQPANLPR
jgi:hypothetical protein